MDLFPVMQKEQEFWILLFRFLSAHWKFNLLTEFISCQKCQPLSPHSHWTSLAADRVLETNRKYLQCLWRKETEQTVQSKKLARSLAIQKQERQFKEQSSGYHMCPRHHTRIPSLLRPGSIAERSVAAADTNRVHFPRRAKRLISGRGYQTGCWRCAGFAIHDSCDTEQRLLSLVQT